MRKISFNKSRFKWLPWPAMSSADDSSVQQISRRPWLWLFITLSLHTHIILWKRPYPWIDHRAQCGVYFCTCRAMFLLVLMGFDFDMDMREIRLIYFGTEWSCQNELAFNRLLYKNFCNRFPQCDLEISIVYVFVSNIRLIFALTIG